MTRTKPRSHFVISAIAAISILWLSACSAGNTSTTPSASAAQSAAQSAGTPAASFEAGTTMAKLHDAGAIKIGTKFDQPLFGLVGPDGTPVGFDVEIGKLIASKLGIDAGKIKWVETVSANREPFIQNGTVDLVVATYTINDKRKEAVSFAGPYYTAGQDILVLAGNPEGIKGPEDLKGKNVCSVAGSTSEKNIAKYEVKLITTDTYSNCLEPLRNGAVIAVTTDNVILAGLAAQNEGEFEVVGNPFTSEPYGIGVAHDDTAFRNFVNDVLEASYADGTWKSLWEATAGKVLDTPEPPKVDRY